MKIAVAARKKEQRRRRRRRWQWLQIGGGKCMLLFRAICFLFLFRLALFFFFYAAHIVLVFGVRSVEQERERNHFAEEWVKSPPKCLLTTPSSCLPSLNRQYKFQHLYLESRLVVVRRTRWKIQLNFPCKTECCVFSATSNSTLAAFCHHWAAESTGGFQFNKYLIYRQ